MGLRRLEALQWWPWGTGGLPLQDRLGFLPQEATLLAGAVVLLTSALGEFGGGAALVVPHPRLLGPGGPGALLGACDLSHHRDMRVLIRAFNGDRPG
jgi:hypothetical protein